MSERIGERVLRLTRIRVGVITLTACVMCAPQVFASPLHDAARDGDIAMVNELIAEGADINEYGYWNGCCSRSFQNSEITIWYVQY